MTAAPPRRHYLVTLALLTIAGLSFALMQTLVIPALPFFQREFGTTASWVTWIATGFLLSSSVLTPILGKLGDAYGKERLLVVSLAIFGLASLAAAFAWSLESLIAFRVLQGAGAAVFPLSFGIIRDEFPPEKVGVGIGTVSSVFGAGGGVGLVLSGVIVEHLDWQWLFLIGAVPVLVATVLIALFVPESPIKTPARPDYLGGAALSAALASLLVAISEGERWGWTSARELGLLALAAGLFALWVRIEGRVPEPLVDLRTFARREMAATNLTTLLIGFSMFACFILLPSFVTIEFGASPVQIGLYFVPSSLAMMVAGPLAGALTGRIGPVVPLRIGIALAGLGLVLLATVHHASWTIYAWMTLLGTGIAFAFAALGTLVIQHSRPEETGVASGMNTIMRTVGGAFGAQIAAAVITANTLAGTQIPLERGFTIAFAIGACGAAAALLPTLLLRRPGRPVGGLDASPA
jgi:EmrB/QacA subfamily drug resistance transporter